MANPRASMESYEPMRRMWCLGLGLALTSCQPPEAPRRAPADPGREPYSVSFVAGGRDAEGHFLGGTELMNLVAAHDKLYAGVGYWMDRPGSDPEPGPQILVLDTKDGHWRQEVAFDHTRYTRLSAMDLLTFHVSGAPVEILFVGLDGTKGGVFSQKAPGVWEDTQFPLDTNVRSFVVHTDAKSGVESVFVGSGKGEESQNDGAIMTATYDPQSPGRIRWNAKPEFTAFKNRVMSMTECGGQLFFAAKPSIYRRDDIAETWTTLYSYPIVNPYNASKNVSGFRGLTCIEGPSGPALLSAFEGIPGDIMRIDTKTGTAVTEAVATTLLSTSWAAAPKSAYVLAGYNDLPLVGHARLFGLLAPASNDPRVARTSGWFLSREGTSYRVHEVKALPAPYAHSDAALYSIRTIAVSPFPEDQGRVLYLGGYDGHFTPDHNTAWLYRVGTDTALR